jgi:hypothetical protein
MTRSDGSPAEGGPWHESSIEEISMMKRTRPRPTWDHLSLEELAEQQGVKPVNNLEEVASLWPVDDDPDELLRFILDLKQA